MFASTFIDLKFDRHASHTNWDRDPPNLQKALASSEQVASIPLVEDFLSILQNCRKDKDLELAKSVHLSMCSNGLEAHMALENFLVPVFVDCGSMRNAQKAFNKLLYRKEHSWTSLIQGYVECGDLEHALSLSQRMEQDSVLPGSHTFVALLKACTRLRSKEKGEVIHAAIAKYGLERDVFVGNTLVDMYAKCGSVMKAKQVFEELPIQDSIAWNALLGGYAECGFGKEALRCYEQMKLKGIFPTTVTFVGSLRACSGTHDLHKGREIHTEVAYLGYESNYYVGNILVDMYAKCGLLDDAVKVFGSLQLQDVIAWTALIVGYAECGYFQEVISSFQSMQLNGVSPELVSWNALILSYSEQGERDMALNLYNQMQERGLSPDSVTWLSVLKVCGNRADLETAKLIHAQIFGAAGIENIVSNALIDVYGKCASMVNAQQVFDAMTSRVSETWTALITGYARLGESEIAFNLFDKMRRQKMQPNDITFLSLLSACCHAGLVHEGQAYFDIMKKDYAIPPSLKHYCCMVDLLSRAGQISEAMVLLESMGFHPDLIMWSSVLNGCCKWGNVKIGRQAFEQLVRLDKRFGAAYIMMSKIYVDAHMCEEANKVEAMRVAARASSEMGESWLEIDRALQCSL